MDAESRCAVCNRPNGCDIAAGRGSCWCYAEQFDADLIEWLGARGLDETCLCSDCAVGDVPSPCVHACSIGADATTCTGCARTLDEIAAWSSLDAIGKARVWLRLRGVVTPG